jgi:hypothetical protein
MAGRKRNRAQADIEEPAANNGAKNAPVEEKPMEISLLEQIRSMSEFAYLAQFLFMFGDLIHVAVSVEVRSFLSPLGCQIRYISRTLNRTLIMLDLPNATLGPRA